MIYYGVNNVGQHFIKIAIILVKVNKNVIIVKLLINKYKFVKFVNKIIQKFL